MAKVADKSKDNLKSKIEQNKEVVATSESSKVNDSPKKSKPIVEKTIIKKEKKIKTVKEKILKTDKKKKIIPIDEKTSDKNTPVSNREENIVKKENKKEETAIEKKLKALINLQSIDSQIDKIRIIRGELPLEIQDLEDEIVGIQTRIENFVNEVNTLEEAITEKKNIIKQSQILIKKYEAQQSNVRNNREYDSLSKEMEFQNLEIQLCEKRIKEYKVTYDSKKEIIEKSQVLYNEKLNDVEIKKLELTDIVAETEKDENILHNKSLENQKIIEERLLNAYKKIRKNARNGLAVVFVERDSCGGCFNKIPPQRQLEIRIHKKIIVCEYCGRILVDPAISNS